MAKKIKYEDTGFYRKQLKKESYKRFMSKLMSLASIFVTGRVQQKLDILTGCASKIEKSSGEKIEINFKNKDCQGLDLLVKDLERQGVKIEK